MASQAIPDAVPASRLAAALGHEPRVKRVDTEGRKLAWAIVERWQSSAFGHRLHDLGWTVLGVRHLEGDRMELTLCPGLK